MQRTTGWIPAWALCLLLQACGEHSASAPDAAGGQDRKSAATVDSSGKVDTKLADLPAEVIETVRRARPGLTLLEAEYETRDGREYYDVGGILPDDRKIELDLLRVDGTWTVVEIQRDIGPADLPAPVADALSLAVPGWEAERIIESDQGDGTVIYEFFGPGDGGQVKHEVKWAGGVAEVLSEEWAH